MTSRLLRDILNNSSFLNLEINHSERKCLMGIVQVIAGGGYLLQKIFLLFAEGNKSATGRRLRILGWIAYLVGLPMWLIIFYDKSNWILVFVEGGGAPSMILGLIIALREQPEEKPPALGFIIALREQPEEEEIPVKEEESPKWLDAFAVVMTCIGIGVSLYSFGGLFTLTQILELFVAIGFLIGTYLVAKKNPWGWFFYLIMNGSAGTLMWVEDLPVLAIQQAFSFLVVLMALGKALWTRHS